MANISHLYLEIGNKGNNTEVCSSALFKIFTNGWEQETEYLVITFAMA